MQFHIANMICGGCARTVTETLKSLDATAVVRIDLGRRILEVDTTASRAAIETALANANYPAHFIGNAKIGA